MGVVKRIISYPLSVIFYLFFGLTLVVFHPIQWFSYTVGGPKMHRGSVNLMNLFLLRCLHLLVVRVSYKNGHTLPKNRSLIIVSNHQSMFDIPLLSWYLRKYKPKFISKIELGKGIPSISYNLRKGGNVLIDRKNPKQSLPALSKFGKFISENNFAAVIFPEGTRSRTGKPKDFAHTGLKILLKNAPDALVVPVTINNSWKLLEYGNFPMGIGIHLTLEVQEPIEVGTSSVTDVIELTESRVKAAVHY
ncbi:lysophospholipid acyltransferase family protein [Aquimarina intermedia]|uniref:1-acyl-sn-glycerol-3-phosphate acyltransferase n=1 Tax=Aquimarina intermedia TaxID=350814 RepID=A0A5S5CA25_9FLAO|nr:lysophospholipid acyltransferase family protein [Aquimarina intermedia]TYP76194.1 1-acyl-sn-glycerol-3-phosphate acyltransferase [Aquimarina intermedia]